MAQAEAISTTRELPAPRRWPWPLAIVIGLGILVLLAAVIRLGPLTPLGRSWIVSVATGQKIGRFGRLEVDGLRGDVWGDFSVGRLAIRDPRGVWIEARDLTMRWDAGDLLHRRLHIRAITAGRVAVLRRPNLGPVTPPTPSLVSVDLDAVRGRIELEPALSGRLGVYDLRAALRVERQGPLAGWLTAASVLAAGDFLRANFDLGHKGAFRVVADGVEANGGALAGAAGLAADKPFALHARASGDARSGAFNLVTRVGATTPLQGVGAWNEAGGRARGRVDLAASSFLARYVAMVGPSASFDVAGRGAGVGRFAVRAVARTDNVTATGAGEIDLAHLATGPKGLAVELAAADVGRLLATRGFGSGRLTGTLTGDTREWRFAGAQRLQAIRTANYTLASVAGPLNVQMANGGLRVIAAARGEGGAGRGLLAAWLGARPSAAADVERLGDGRLLFRSLRLEGPGGFVAARGGRGLLGGLTLNGSARLANLAAARAGASGAVAANWSASQGGVGKPWTFGFDAAAARFASGLGAEIDRLLGPSPRLRASGDWSPSRLAISDAVLTGAAGSASGAGTVGAGGALAIKLAWTARGPLTVGPVTIGGAASGSGDVVGSLTQPRADVIADFASVDALGTALRKAHLVLTFERQPSAANGRFALAAATDYGPAHAAAAFRLAPGGLDLSGINVAGAGVQLAGAAALRQGEPSSADLTFALSRGEFLTAGHASGRLKIIEAAGGPRVDLEARADEAVLPGGAAISTLRLSAAGPWARLPYRASAEGLAIGAPWSLKGSGLLLQAGASHDLSFAGAGRLRNIDVRTLAPARVTFGPEGQSAHMRLAVASGRAQVDLSRHGEEIAANARLENLGLNLLNPDLVGRFDANLAARGHGETLTGDLEAKLAGAGGRDLRGAAPVDGTITARLVPGRLLMSAALGNSQGLSARGEVSLPAVASAAPFRIALARKQAMRGDFAIDGELKPVWDLMMGADRSLAGRVVASGTLAGTLADPRVTGAATLDRGAFHDSGTGLKLRDVSLRAVLADNAVDVATFKADDGGRGTMAGSGRLSLERAGASNLTVALSGFRLIDNDLAQATGSGRINLERGGDGRVKLAGALMIDRAQISPNPPVATGVTPMEVVEVHRPREMEERFAPRAASAPPIALDVSLRAPRGIFVKGRGLDLELSLDAHVRGTTAAPILTGVARVVRGDYDFAGQRFRIDDTGVVQLGSTAEAIQLDLTATRENPTLTAVVRIQGTAAKPTITLTSTPALPQDEVLSQVLFGASASQLSALQAAQLASAVSGLASGGGFDVIGGLRNLAHLDRLAIGGDATTGSTIAGGKYITDTVYLELTGGGREGSGAQVEWRVRKHVSLVSRVTSQGDSQVSIRWRKDY